MSFCNKCGEVLRSTACPCGGQQTQSSSGMDWRDNVGDKYSNAYLSSGLNAGIETGLKRMLGKDDNDSVDFECTGCNKALTKSREVFPAPFEAGRDEGKPFCETCYSSRYSRGNCGECSKAVLGLGREWIKHSDGKIYHRECYEKKGARCKICNVVIIGEVLHAEEYNYHPKCFNCEGCNTNLSTQGSFAPVNGKIYCESCGNSAKRAGGPTHRQGESATTVRRVGPSDDEIDRRNDNIKAAEQRQRELDYIKKGLDPYTGKPLSDDVLSPSVAKMNVSSSSPTASKPAASSFNSARAAAGVPAAPKAPAAATSPASRVADTTKCAGCSDFIGAEGIQLPDGRIYHDGCLLCSGCGKGFGSELKFMKRGDQLYHPACLKDSRVTAVRNDDDMKCDLCQKQIHINEKYLTSGTNAYHATCFKCVTCKQPIGTKSYADLATGPVCNTCLQNRDQGGSVLTGAYHQGFTVNPVTGQREYRGPDGAKVSASPSPSLGGADACPKCKKSVYPADKVSGPKSTTWHRSCLKCAKCSKILDSSASTNADFTEAFCKNCGGVAVKR